MSNMLFMPSNLSEGGFAAVPSRPIYRSTQADEEAYERMGKIARGEFGGLDQAQAAQQMQIDLINALQRAQASSGVPIREDLEAEVSSLIPPETPLRNRLPRSVGSSSATSWEQETSVGGGYGVNTTVTTGATSATQQVGSTAGMQAGGTLYFQTANVYATVSSVTDATHVVLTASITTTTSEVVTTGAYSQPGGNPVQGFFSESGAPANSSPVYAKKTASYKLLGTMFSITGFAMAAGASFTNQLAMEKTAAIRRLMLIEENALINSDSTIVTAPYGDGTNAFGFDGLLKLTTTANGVPVPQVQTSVGALTTAHIDAQLTRTHNNGARDPYILCNAQEALSLTHLAEASGSIIRVMATQAADAILGVQVVGYKHPISGQIIPILVSRFMPAGTMIFGADYLPDGKQAMDVRVLPQVQLPDLAPNVQIQGYVAQELAPATTSPQSYPGIVSVFEVPRMKGATVFAKSTGLTAV